MIESLATHPGIGFVVVKGASGPVAVGALGAMQLDTGVVTGEDPLAAFPRAREDFARVAQFPAAPDIYVNSLYDPSLGEVAAFEELVGLPRRPWRLADPAHARVPSGLERRRRT